MMSRLLVSGRVLKMVVCVLMVLHIVNFIVTWNHLMIVNGLSLNQKN